MKSKKNTMKITFKNNNIKGYKIIRGGAQGNKQAAEIKAVATQPKSAKRKRINVPWDLKKNINYIQKEMSKGAQMNKLLEKDYECKLEYLKQMEVLGHIQYAEKERLSEELRKKSQNLMNFLEKKMKDCSNMGKKLQKNANKENLRNWVNKTFPLLEASEENIPRRKANFKTNTKKI